VRNISLTISYDGTDYVGWQVQPNGPSVQAAVEEAILKLTGETLRIFSAGRTDSGVHAVGQVSNFQTSSTIPCENIQRGLQNFLPEDVIIRDAHDVPADFHATHSAVKKRYRYIIRNSRVKNPFLRQYAWNVSVPLDDQAMHEAAQVMVGRHDFRCFESHFPNRASSVRTVLEATVVRNSGWPVWWQSESLLHPPTTGDDEYICFDIVADGFLYNMVRAIMGTLVKVGQGTWSADDVSRIIENGDRSQAGETAPACGLYLIHVDYGEAATSESSLNCFTTEDTESHREK
jgi:tRNA pseudouridine38-40 synthase